MGKIYFVFGLCGAGKTTLVNKLNIEGVIMAFDFDSTGVPSTPTHHWRLSNTLYWVEKLSSSKEDVLLAGFMYPSEIISCSGFNDIASSSVFVYLLEDLSLIEERLLSRGWKKEKIDWTLKQESIIINEVLANEGIVMSYDNFIDYIKTEIG